MKVFLKFAIIATVVFFGFLIFQPQTTSASACVYNATQRCVGNSVFMYDSCGRQGQWIKDCPYKCVNGQCIEKQSTYINHYKKVCHNDNLYWQDSNGVKNDVYSSCSDGDELTKDSCLNGKCVNEIIEQNNQNECALSSIDASVFCGNKDGLENLSKNIIVSADETVSCLIIVKNISTAPLDGVAVRAEIPSEIVNVAELKVDGASFNGNVTAGINIGSVLPNTSKLITFTGKSIMPITQGLMKQITAIATSDVFAGIDSVAINFQPTVAGASTAASIASPAESSSFVKFLKRWYIWILIAIVLIFLFIVIFRRISSNV